MDRAYIDYEKLEQLSQNGVVYVTKMKKGLKYKVISDVMYMDAKGGMAYRIQEVEFTKKKGMKKDDVSAEGGKKLAPMAVRRSQRSSHTVQGLSPIPT